MTETPEDLEPCVRGCTWDPIDEDETPRPKPAKHGRLCNSCFYRLTGALKLIPDLMANMRAQMIPGGAQRYSERVTGGGDGSPAPLNVGPLDASDSLFAKLVSWTEVFGAELHTPQPSVAVWINFREVQGSRPVSVETAHQLAGQLTAWFEVRLEGIAASPSAAAFVEDICYGWEDARGVFSLSAAYGVEPRPVKDAEKRECPVCGQRELFVKPPDKLNEDVEIMCGRCAHVLAPDTKKYAAYLEHLAHG